MTTIDLTPFGFTPTESLAYTALVEHGPLGGYALAKVLSIARANAYQALDGLVAKRLAVATGGRPQRYRPIEPRAALALISERAARQLDRLEEQLSDRGNGGGPAVLSLSGRRALHELALRTAARSRGEVRCLAPREFLEALAPVWHKRAADGSATRLWAVGEGHRPLPFEVAGWVGHDQVARHFDGPAVILLADDAAIVARLDPAAASGYWTTHPALVGLARAALGIIVRA